MTKSEAIHDEVKCYLQQWHCFQRWGSLPCGVTKMCREAIKLHRHRGWEGSLRPASGMRTACLVALLLLIKQLYLCPLKRAPERARCSGLAGPGIHGSTSCRLLQAWAKSAKALSISPSPQVCPSLADTQMGKNRFLTSSWGQILPHALRAEVVEVFDSEDTGC